VRGEQIEVSDIRAVRGEQKIEVVRLITFNNK